MVLIPSDSCSFQLTSQTVTPSSQWLTSDCDGDGVTNGQEVLDGTDSLDSCDFEDASVTLTQSASWNNADCDGDGVTNGQEVVDGTDFDNPCEANMSNVTLPLGQAFLEEDCDGDGLTNGEEIGPNPNAPFDPNGNGIPDYLEVNNHTPSDDLEIFNLVTPNGDGDNSVFVIRNIERYPENELEVYNRWGVKVYSVDGYGQDDKFFRGISEGRVTVSQVSELPVGTYWYILKYKNASGEQKQRVGYLYLDR
jgi:gliding motility-associated-like protein